jgi:hypothetical protein
MTITATTANVRPLGWLNLADDDLLEEVSIDEECRVWVPTYCPVTDAVLGSHVAEVLPAGQRYGLKLVGFIRRERAAAELAARAAVEEPF